MQLKQPRNKSSMDVMWRSCNIDDFHLIFGIAKSTIYNTVLVIIWSALVSLCYYLFCCRLASLTAAVMLSKDVPVYLFSTYVPTPFVVRYCVNKNLL